LEKLLDINKNIFLSYILKDELKIVFSRGWVNSVDMLKYLTCFIGKMKAAGLKTLNKFARKLKKHWPGIISFARSRIHTFILEGINSKIKENKRSAFGSHDFNYFRLKIKFTFQGNRSYFNN